MPDEWRREQSTRRKPLPPVDEEELLTKAAADNLPHSPVEPYRWGVYLERQGQRWSGDMNPIEYFHWTAQVAFGYRMAKAQV
jgi:hypothetical protein